MATTGARTLFVEVSAERGRLRRLLSNVKPSTLTRVPAAGERSIVENLRHLLFHEQGVQRRLPGAFTWSPLGLAPPGLQKREDLRVVGSQPSTNLREVMSAWDAIHRSVGMRLRDTDPSIATALEKNLRHLRNHIKIIERILRKAERERW